MNELQDAELISYKYQLDVSQILLNKTVTKLLSTLSLCDLQILSINSLEAVRKHMEAKRHWKIHFGDADEEEEAELEEFYDYSSRSLSSKFIFFLFLIS